MTEQELIADFDRRRAACPGVERHPTEAALIDRAWQIGKRVTEELKGTARDTIAPESVATMTEIEVLAMVTGMFARDIATLWPDAERSCAWCNAYKGDDVGIRDHILTCTKHPLGIELRAARAHIATLEDICAAGANQLASANTGEGKDAARIAELEAACTLVLTAYADSETDFSCQGDDDGNEHEREDCDCLGPKAINACGRAMPRVP